MFMSFKRSERKTPEIAPAGGRLSDALLRSVSQGILFLDSTGRLMPQASQSLGTLFRREEFVDLTFEKLLAPLVTAKTLSAVRAQTTRLFRPEAEATAEDLKVLQDVELRLPNLSDGSSSRAHYAFEFCAMEESFAPYAWLVTVTDITTRVQSARELEDLRACRVYGHSRAPYPRASCSACCISGAAADPLRDVELRDATWRRALRRIPAKDRRLDEGDQYGVEETGARTNLIS